MVIVHAVCCRKQKDVQLATKQHWLMDLEFNAFYGSREYFDLASMMADIK